MKKEKNKNSTFIVREIENNTEFNVVMSKDTNKLPLTSFQITRDSCLDPEI